MPINLVPEEWYILTPDLEDRIRARAADRNQLIRIHLRAKVSDARLDKIAHDHGEATDQLEVEVRRMDKDKQTMINNACWENYHFYVQSLIDVRDTVSKLAALEQEYEDVVRGVFGRSNAPSGEHAPS